MKRININLIVLVSLALSSLSNACPSCVGRIEHDSPAFFRDEFYVPTAPEAQTAQLPTTASEAASNESPEDA